MNALEEVPTQPIVDSHTAQIDLEHDLHVGSRIQALDPLHETLVRSFIFGAEVVAHCLIREVLCDHESVVGVLV